MLGEGLVNFLANNANVTALLGTSSSRADETNGVFPGEMPEGATLPALVYTDVHAENEMTFDGPDPFTAARVQVSAYGSIYSDAKRLARVVREELEKYTGTLSDGSDVDSIHRITEVDLFIPQPFSYATHIDFEVFFRDDSQ